MRGTLNRREGQKDEKGKDRMRQDREAGYAEQKETESAPAA